MSNFNEGDVVRHGDGKFAEQHKTEPSGVSLAPAPRRPQLNGWPEALPEPEVSFKLDAENDIITTVKIPDTDNVIIVWTRDNGHDGENNDVIGSARDDYDEDDVEQAREWAQAKHDQIYAQSRKAMKDALKKARRRILCSATGAADVPTDDELYAMTEDGVTRDAQLAYTSLAARRILAAHPSADRAELLTSDYDNGPFVHGAVLYKADGERIGEYSQDSDDDVNSEDAAEEIVQLVNAIEHGPDPFWTELSAANNRRFSVDTLEADAMSIDLKAAAAWNPES